jgi:hypothetical protein
MQRLALAKQTCSGSICVVMGWKLDGVPWFLLPFVIFVVGTENMAHVVRLDISRAVVPRTMVRRAHPFPSRSFSRLERSPPRPSPSPLPKGSVLASRNVGRLSLTLPSVISSFSRSSVSLLERRSLPSECASSLFIPVSSKRLAANTFSPVSIVSSRSSRGSLPLYCWPIGS